MTIGTAFVGGMMYGFNRFDNLKWQNLIENNDGDITSIQFKQNFQIQAEEIELKIIRRIDVVKHNSVENGVWVIHENKVKQKNKEFRERFSYAIIF